MCVCAYGSEIDARIERPQESHIKQIVESLSHGSGAINHDAVLNADIPTPSVRLVEDYERTNKPNFQLRNAGTCYISYRMPRDMFSVVEYDLDADDERWLNDFNQDRRLLNEDQLEYMIDRFEKEQSLQVRP